MHFQTARLRSLTWIAAVACAMASFACSSDDGSGGGGETASYEYDVPLDMASPWPKFRRNALQNGRSPVRPLDSGRDPWVFQTAKGIFSTAVIGGDGTVYIGSADHNFYAIDRNGELRWSFPTGEIIDSSALLDDAGRVIFGSGDGHLYALDRNDGALLWSYEADDPAANGAFITWFEGNVAMAADGTLYVPNDNYCTYAIERASGTPLWCARTLDQTWSLPAVNPLTGQLFMGSNFYFLQNVLSIDPADGSTLWTDDTLGSVAASPLLTSAQPDGLVVVGSFDGILRAYTQGGDLVWQTGLRDHIYASPAQMEDGTIVQPGADGTIYAIDPSNGTIRWAFDTAEPIRSSPAIDADDNVYVGSGEGRLFVLNSDGTLRWSIRLIEEDRDDLNASPALGRDGIVIAGESGGIFSVPYDYCLRDRASDDRRCRVGSGEDLPNAEAQLLFTTRFGRLLNDPPSEIEANQSLTFTLLVREAGDTTLALLDAASLEVSAEPAGELIVDVSGDQKFVTVVPAALFAPPEGGTVSLRLRGNYLVNPERNGLHFSGGEVGGHFDQTFTFDVLPRSGAAFPLPAASSPGEPTGVLEMLRLAAPLPTILPSYNQIGFDSLHYLIGLIDLGGGHVLGWGIEGKLEGDDSRTVIDPDSLVRFPIDVRYEDGLLTLINQQGFAIEFNGFFIGFELFRAATALTTDGEVAHSASVNAKTICGDINFYGPFLQMLGYCNPITDILNAAGAAELRRWEGGVHTPPDGAGRIAALLLDAGALTVEVADSNLRLAEHSVGVLLVDAATNTAVALDYTQRTTVTAAPDGTVQSVRLALERPLSGDFRVFLMVDVFAVDEARLGSRT
jgi:outer membrane protein assembly factor BamB